MKYYWRRFLTWLWWSWLCGPRRRWLLRQKVFVYRDYTVEQNFSCWSNADRFCYVHVDYDGPEDNRTGYARSPEDCMHDIDERIDEGFDK